MKKILDFFLKNYDKKITRRLKDMKGLFRKEISKNPIIYEVFQKGYKKFNCDFTVLRAGKINNEFYFTKGHFHKRKRPEIYIFLKGSGYLLLQDRKGNCKALKIREGNVVYVEPGYAHRTVNRGKEKMIFLALYPSDAGHDYGKIKKMGFNKIVVQMGRKVKILGG